MMGQKIEYDFRFESAYVNQFFRALLAFKCSAFFYGQKCSRFRLKVFRR